MQEYDNILAFDQALLEALKNCLTNSTVDRTILSKDDQEPCDESQVDNNYDNLMTILTLLERTDDAEYAIGITRDQSFQQGLFASNETQSKSSSSTSDTENRPVPPPAHAVCLLQKIKTVDDDSTATNCGWNVKDCFALVQLSTSDDNWFHVKKHDTYKIQRAGLVPDHGIFGQMALQALDITLSCHARRGVVNDHLPMALIVGKRRGDPNLLLELPTDESTPSSDKPDPDITNKEGGDDEESDEDEPKAKKVKGKTFLRWVLGRLDIPMACGNAFHFSIQDFDQFHCDNKEKEDHSIEMALSVYLDTLLFGVNVGKRVMRYMIEKNIPPPVPASGQRLIIEQVTLGWHLCASPIVGANPVYDPSDRGCWKVSQGDLFRGKLNLQEMFPASTRRYYSEFALFPHDQTQEVDVLIKVTSTAVHEILVEPRESIHALWRLTKMKEIGNVLYAVGEMSSGSITIMADLSTLGYRLLKPKDYPDKLAVLWRGFKELVKTVLLPMAEEFVIHPDVRPAYDLTSNILVKFEGEGSEETATMRLIDYESFVDSLRWYAPYDGRYVRVSCSSGAVFLWWQCVAVAYTWKEKVVAKSLQKAYPNGIVCRLENAISDKSGQSWWAKKFRETAELHRMDLTLVTQVLEDLDELFDEH
jgi:hypothetical protein